MQLIDKIIDNKKEELQKNGFLIYRNFFTDSQITTLYENAKLIFIQQLKKLNLPYNTNDDFKESLVKLFNTKREIFINCGKTIQQGAIALYKLCINEKLLGELKNLGLEEPNLCTRPVLYFNHPKLAAEKIYYKTPPHQDWPSMQGSLDSLIVWVPLVDIHEGNGPLGIIPKSHTQGVLSNNILNNFAVIDNVFVDDDFINVTLNKGDILIFSSFLVHKSGEITNDEIRWSCHFRYNNLNEVDFIERGYPSPYQYTPQTKI